MGVLLLDQGKASILLANQARGTSTRTIGVLLKLGFPTLRGVNRVLATTKAKGGLAPIRSQEETAYESEGVLLPIKSRRVRFTYQAKGVPQPEKIKRVRLLDQACRYPVIDEAKTRQGESYLRTKRKEVPLSYQAKGRPTP